MAGSKTLVKKKIIFIPLVVVLCSFGLGGIWLAMHSARQMSSKNPQSLRATGTNQQAATNSIAKPSETIFEVPKQFQGQTIAQMQVNDTDKVIALTFDDGPAPKYTEQVLKILKKENIKATFFCVGEMVHDYPQIAKLVVADGHAIGNHTWNHWLKKMDSSTAAHEIESTATQMYETMGIKTSLFRPPFGSLNNGVADYAKKKNYAILMWSDDAEDFRRPPVSQLVNKVLKYATPGGMVLMHDGGGNRANTVQALPEIIDTLKKRGYRFVTVPELLKIPQKPLATTTAQVNAPKKGT